MKISLLVDLVGILEVLVTNQHDNGSSGNEDSHADELGQSQTGQADIGGQCQNDEDQNQNKKYFYPFVEEGLRYEIKDFVAAVLSDGYYHSKVSKKENLKMAEVQEQYINGINLFKI